MSNVENKSCSLCKIVSFLDGCDIVLHPGHLLCMLISGWPCIIV